jgi:gliding motility-associated-like protein
MRGAIVCLFIVGFLYSFDSRAQYASKNNRFLASEIKGCAGLSVQINHNPAYLPVLTPCGSGGITCVIVFGDGRLNQTFTDGQVVQYPTAGNFDARIVYSGVEANNDTISFTITPNLPPAFEVYSCSGNEAQIKVTDTSYPFYKVDFETDGVVDATVTPAAPVVNHAYGVPSSQTVSVRGFNGPGSADNCTTQGHSVTVAPTLPVADISQVQVLNTTDVKVDLNTDNTILYRFMIGTNNSTSFQQYKTFYSETASAVSETIPGIRPDDNFYCFRIDTTDPCRNNVPPGPSSNIVCSLNFDGVAQNNQNVLSWTTAPASGTHLLTNFTFSKDGATTTPVTSPRVDTDVVCGTTYQYLVTTNYPGGVRSISRPQDIRAISSDIPPAIRNISAMVNAPGNEVQLTWAQDDPDFTVSEYTLTKSVDGKSSVLATLQLPGYTDTQYTTTVPTCYRLTYKDACNNVSPPSAEACPVQLGGSVNGDNVISLGWSAYTGWQNGIDHYTIEQLNDQGQVIGTIDQAPGQTTYSDNTIDPNNQVYRFRIYAHAVEGGVPQSLSNEIEVVKNPNIYYPTAFTPNGDDLNSTYKVIGQFVERFEMRIFNRWGEMMYSTTELDSPGWDGMYKGTLMPEATYVFRAKLTDKRGRTFDKSGSFFLLRKR